MDQWAWTLSSTLVVIGWGVTLIPTVIGWVISANKDKKAAANAAMKRDEDAKRDSETIDTLRGQLEASQETVNALREQVEQLKEANRIAAAANPYGVVPWGDAEWTGKGALFKVRNESARNVIVESVRADQQELRGMFRFSRDVPFVCEPGDTIEYWAIACNLGRPDARIEWHWENDDAKHSTRRASIK